MFDILNKKHVIMYNYYEILIINRLFIILKTFLNIYLLYLLHRHLLHVLLISSRHQFVHWMKLDVMESIQSV